MTRRATRAVNGPKDRKNVLGRKARLKCNGQIASRRATRVASGPKDIERVLGRKAKLECKYATAVDAHQLRNAEYRVSDPKNRENAWPQGYAEIQ